MHICTYIDGDWNHCFNTENLNLGQFYNVRVTQYEADDGIYDGVFAGRHMWEVYMDGVKVGCPQLTDVDVMTFYLLFFLIIMSPQPNFANY